MTRYVAVVLMPLMATLPCTAQLTVTSPNGGEAIDVGQIVPLRWTGTAFPDSTSIDYSSEAGTTWTSIVRNWQQSTYLWLVPNTRPQHDAFFALQVHFAPHGV